MKSSKEIINVLDKKILILDGAIGTMIQNENLKEEDYRGKKFENNSVPLKGNNDILNITKERLIYDIHIKYRVLPFFFLNFALLSMVSSV